MPLVHITVTTPVKPSAHPRNIPGYPSVPAYTLTQSPVQRNPGYD